MKNVYNNGELLGTVKNIKEYNKYLLKTFVIDKDIYEELEKELENYNDADIITIDCDNPYGYYIKKWEQCDIVFKGGQK